MTDSAAARDARGPRQPFRRTSRAGYDGLRRLLAAASRHGVERPSRISWRRSSPAAAPSDDPAGWFVNQPVEVVDVRAELRGLPAAGRLSRIAWPPNMPRV